MVMLAEPIEIEAAVHGATLAADGQWHRALTRAPAQRQDDYEARYDAHTLIYDAFRVGDDVEMVGPPLLNLEQGMRPLDLRGGGRRFARRLTWQAKDRLQRFRIEGVPAGVSTLRMSCQLGSFALSIGDDLAGAFADRRVLVTQSWNNPLPWIAEWVDHHSATQGIDAVVIYDNSSSAYDADAIRAVLRARPRISVFAVIAWPFPFGATGGPEAVWDSDFGQHGIWEHAARRLCRTAATITFADIDELIVGAPPAVTDRALASPSGVCSYRRRSVVNLPERRRRSGLARSYRDYCRFDPAAPLLSTKYTVAPSVLRREHQLMVHRVDGIEVAPEADVLARHFDGMRIDWRAGERSPVDELQPSHLDSSTLSIDLELQRTLAAGPEAS